MINKAFFFDHARQVLFSGKLSQQQVNGLNAILDEWQANYSDKDDRWLAYMLATAHHETDRKIAPIEEYGKGKTRPYGKRIKMNRQPYTDTDSIFYGRGFVQLTWYENYQKAGKKLGIDLLHKPELALDLKYATEIMFIGMIEGWFTGKKLSDYFLGAKQDWINARRIINGTDKANLIAGYARNYYSCISYTAV
jgi:predicted chitinase